MKLCVSSLCVALWLFAQPLWAATDNHFDLTFTNMTANTFMLTAINASHSAKVLPSSIYLNPHDSIRLSIDSSKNEDLSGTLQFTEVAHLKATLNFSVRRQFHTGQSYFVFHAKHYSSRVSNLKPNHIIAPHELSYESATVFIVDDKSFQ